VEAYSFHPDFVVSLLEGSLNITSPGNSASSLLLEPCSLARLKDGVLVSGPITDYNLYRWREGLICFDNILFPELMSLFEKYYAVKIHIDNASVKSYICTGKFRQSDGIDYALNVLRRDVRFDYKREENTNSIHIK
ncbi:MAG: DUF4974 domain-containing protein, partial [Tannerellaceae bacterium]|jgi:ferric-dicitrate binding protein FerR (iron transport regulator)|nr:DUF4974 domain-containing protein [Tannerellaceae bacterium]